MTTRHQASSLLEGSTSQRAPWITVTGGKGGVGKTLIAVNLAVLLQKAGYRTLLVDLDPGLANVDVHMRIAPRWTIEDMVFGGCSHDDAITEGPSGVSVLCGKSGSTRLTDGLQGLAAHVTGAVEHAAKDFDVVICDTGAGIGPLVLEAARHGSIVLAVTTPEPAAVTDNYALCKLLLTRGLAHPQILINQVRNADEAMTTSARLNTVCKRFLGNSVPLAGWLRRDPTLTDSITAQRPYCLHGSGGALEDLRAIAARCMSALPKLRRGRSVASG